MQASLLKPVEDQLAGEKKKAEEAQKKVEDVSGVDVRSWWTSVVCGAGAQHSALVALTAEQGSPHVCRPSLGDDEPPRGPAWLVQLTKEKDTQAEKVKSLEGEVGVGELSVAGLPVALMDSVAASASGLWPRFHCGVHCLLLPLSAAHTCTASSVSFIDLLSCGVC